MCSTQNQIAKTTHFIPETFIIKINKNNCTPATKLKLTQIELDNVGPCINAVTHSTAGWGDHFVMARVNGYL